MIVYWSMIAWVLLFYFIYSLGHKNKKEYNFAGQSINNIQQDNEFVYHKIPYIYAILVFGYFVFWIGIRRYVADTSTYIGIFNSISTDFSTAWGNIDWENSKGPLFDAFNVIFKNFISDNYTWWLMTIAIFSGFCVLKTLHKYSLNFFYSSYLFITLVTCTWMMNGMRQFICVSFLFLLCDWLIEGKFLRYLILCCILYYVHATVIVMIPIYFVARSKPWSKKIFAFLVCIILICIFSEPFFNTVDSALSGTAYSGATSQFAEDDGVNPLRVLFYAIPPFLAFWKKDRLSPYFEKYKILPISINMSLVALSLYFVGMFTSGILIGRMPVYADVYNLILIPFVLYFGFEKEDRTWASVLYALVALAYFYTQWNGNNYDSELTGFFV